MLLTQPDQLHPDTQTELQRVLPDGATVYLLGGTAALSQQVQDTIADLGFNTIRYGGATRFETATIIATQGLGDPDTLLAADGGTFANSVIAGAAATTAGTGNNVNAALILTDNDQIPPATQDYLDNRGDNPTTTAIGTAACNAFPTSDCLQGPTTFDTAVAVAQQFFPNPPLVGIATSTDFADALIGGAITGRPDTGPGPIVLTQPDTLPTPITTYLQNTAPTVNTAIIFGGTAAITTTVETDITNALGF